MATGNQPNKSDHNTQIAVVVIGGAIAAIALVYFSQSTSSSSTGVTFSQPDPNSVAALANATAQESQNQTNYLAGMAQNGSALAEQLAADEASIRLAGINSGASVQLAGINAGTTNYANYLAAGSNQNVAQIQASGAEQLAQIQAGAQEAIAHTTANADTSIVGMQTNSANNIAGLQASAAKTSSFWNSLGSLGSTAASFFGKSGGGSSSSSFLTPANAGAYSSFTSPLSLPSTGAPMNLNLANLNATPNFLWPEGTLA